MSIKYHLSNGCSFSTKKTYLSCHQKLGEKLGLEPTINLAKGGRGNDRCVTTTMHWFYKNPERFKDTFVSIGWSSSHRWDYINGPTPDHKVPGIKGAVRDFSYQWARWRTWEQDWISRDPDVDIDYTSTFRLYKNILSMQSFFKHHKIPYLMYWALSNDLQQDGDLIYLKDAVDRKHFYNFEESEHVKENINRYNAMKLTSKPLTIPNTGYVQSHYEYVAQNGLKKAPNDAHPNQQGHHRWADLLYQHVIDNNILQ